MKLGGKIVIGIILLTLVIKTSSTTTALSSEDQIVNPLTLDYNVHVPISITDDNDFISYGFTGTGEKETPYLIEGYNITTTGEKGIFITGTTKYFAIRDCYVNTNMRCIDIYGVAEGTALLINNICTKSGGGSEGGISLYASSGAILTNNTCANNGRGISLGYSSGALLTNNTCNNNGDGIYLENSSNSTLINNTCNNNGDGIYLGYSSGALLTNNTCSNNSRGIYLTKFSNASITNNTFYNCGLVCYNIDMTVEVYLNYTVENNWVNGKKLGFYINLDKAILSEPIYGQLFLINCTETIVSNQVISNASVGLSLFFCEKTNLINNTCNKNIFQGMNIWHCTETILDNNTCNNNGDGIELTLSYDAILTNNIFTNNGIGIWLPYILDTSIITDNLFKENGAYGIYCFSGSNCIIHHNTFIDNNLLGNLVHGFSQAFDLGNNNTWYDTISNEGNRWLDWDGTGPYNIDGWLGAIGNRDLYPLDAEGTPYFDATAPIIDHPTDISYEEGSIDNYITWNPDDLNPSSYEISRNGTIIRSDNWYGGSIVISVDGLETGNYEYICTIYDLYDNSISDTVIVTVTESTTEKSRSEMLIVPLTLIIAAIPLSLRIKKRLNNR